MINKICISKMFLSVFVLFTLFSNIARSEPTINLYLICNENWLSAKTQTKWNTRTIIVEEALSYKNILDRRIDELTKSSEISRISGDVEGMQRYRNESFELEKQRVREISKYQIQITELNIALRNGKDGNCFRTGVLLGIRIQDEIIELDTFVKVGEVFPGSLAERIGVKVGDRMLALNDDAIENSNELVKMLRTHNVGDLLDFKISRDGVILFLNTLNK